MSDVINSELAKFTQLSSQFSFGSQKTQATGLHFEKVLQAKRLSLAKLFTQQKPYLFGAQPKVSEQRLIHECSSGEESEIDITGAADALRQRIGQEGKR